MFAGQPRAPKIARCGSKAQTAGSIEGPRRLRDCYRRRLSRKREHLCTEHNLPPS
jgi:hypothetical protein